MLSSIYNNWRSKPLRLFPPALFKPGWCAWFGLSGQLVNHSFLYWLDSFESPPHSQGERGELQHLSL